MHCALCTARCCIEFMHSLLPPTSTSSDASSKQDEQRVCTASSMTGMGGCVQERLRTLRASLGSAARSLPDDSPQQQATRKGRHAPAESSPPSTQPQPGQARPGDPTALEGLCSLMELHLTTVDQAQQLLHQSLPASGRLLNKVIPSLQRQVVISVDWRPCYSVITAFHLR